LGGSYSYSRVRPALDTLQSPITDCCEMVEAHAKQ
jgi:hypothetical protein